MWLTRPLVTGDQQDRDIVSGRNRIIWAYGSSSSVGYHEGTRGSTTAVFFGSDDSAFPAYDGVWTREFDNYAVPKQVTTYACQAFTFPTDAERHIVAIRPKGATIYNHHAILHVCVNNDYFIDHTSPQLCSGGSGQGSSPLGSTSAGCSGLIWSWAVGMGDFIIPEEAGLRTGAGHISHVILEIHCTCAAAAATINLAASLTRFSLSQRPFQASTAAPAHKPRAPPPHPPAHASPTSRPRPPSSPTALSPTALSPTALSLLAQTTTRISTRASQTRWVSKRSTSTLRARTTRR